MNFGDLITVFQTGTYAVTRRAPGTIGADGLVTPATASVFTITAFVVPGAPAEELQRNPEGMRTIQRRVIYTTTRLQDIGSPDVVSIDGSQWEVEGVADWSTPGGFYQVTLMKRGN